jgi:hypothetical protein
MATFMQDPKRQFHWEERSKTGGWFVEIPEGKQVPDNWRELLELGCLQRIAVSLETMAKKCGVEQGVGNMFEQLRKDAEHWKRQADETKQAGDALVTRLCGELKELRRQVRKGKKVAKATKVKRPRGRPRKAKVGRPKGR